MEHLTGSYQQLKQAQAKFRSCVSDISELTPTSKGPSSTRENSGQDADIVGKEILIPLTSSLYVPGKLTDVENVVIDVGTGYYVKKVSVCHLCTFAAPCCGLIYQNKDEATKHYTTKQEFVQGNLETLQKTIERKQDNAQSVVQVLQMKMQEQQKA